MKRSPTFVVLLFLGLVAVSQALTKEVEEDEEVKVDFEARLKKFVEMHMRTPTEGDVEDWGKEEVSEILKKLLPEDPALREPFLARLFMELMGEEHPMGRGHPYDESQGHPDYPESFGHFHDRKFPSPR